MIARDGQILRSAPEHFSPAKVFRRRFHNAIPIQKLWTQDDAPAVKRLRFIVTLNFLIHPLYEVPAQWDTLLIQELCQLVRP